MGDNELHIYAKNKNKNKILQKLWSVKD